MITTTANSSCKRLETKGLTLEVGNIKSYRLDPFPTYSLQSKAYGLFTADVNVDSFVGVNCYAVHLR